MKKGIQSACVLILSASILLSVLTACGKKPEFNNTADNASSDNQYADNPNIISGDTAPNDSNNPAVPSANGGSNSGGSSSGSSYGGSSSGGSYSGGSYNRRPSGSNSSGNNGTTPPGENTTKPTEPSTTKYVYDIQKIINNAPLKPVHTNDVELDGRIDKIFDEIITDGMSTYEKTRVIFDYLVQTNQYAYLVPRSTETSYVSIYDREVVTRAKTILKNKRGTCIDFAAAFMCMARRIGLNCYMVKGYITTLAGDTYYHGWNTIRVDGIDYTFDSQADFRRADGGPTKFINFGTYYPQVFPVECINLAETTYRSFKTF